MRQQSFEKILSMIADEWTCGSDIGKANRMDNLVVKAQILLSREGDEAVIKELTNND